MSLACLSDARSTIRRARLSASAVSPAGSPGGRSVPRGGRRAHRSASSSASSRPAIVEPDYLPGGVLPIELECAGDYTTHVVRSPRRRTRTAVPSCSTPPPRSYARRAVAASRNAAPTDLYIVDLVRRARPATRPSSTSPTSPATWSRLKAPSGTGSSRSPASEQRAGPSVDEHARRHRSAHVGSSRVVGVNAPTAFTCAPGRTASASTTGVWAGRARRDDVRGRDASAAGRARPPARRLAHPARKRRAALSARRAMHQHALERPHARMVCDVESGLHARAEDAQRARVGRASARVATAEPAAVRIAVR